MANWRIRLRRGNSADAPPDTLLTGEPAIALDTGILYYGDGEENVRRLQIEAGDIIDRGDPDGVASLDNRGTVPPGQLPVHLSTEVPTAVNDTGTKNGDLWLVYLP